MADAMPILESFPNPASYQGQAEVRTVRRKHSRTGLVLPVKVSIVGSAGQFSACTLDASLSGLRLHTRALKPGQLVTVTYRANRCRYRVAWVGKPQDELPNRCGLESIDGKLLVGELEDLCGDRDDYAFRMAVAEVFRITQ